MPASCCWCWAFCPAVRAGALAKTDYKFSFGPGEAAPGCLQVLPEDVFAADAGYGFEPGGKIEAVERERSFCHERQAVLFSVALPEGNFGVTLRLGDPTGESKGESTTTVKAELRRLMLENIHTDAGQIVTKTITVNIRTPVISTGGRVRLKPRETTTEAWAWDGKLTLEFDGKRRVWIRWRFPERRCRRFIFWAIRQLRPAGGAVE